MGTNRKRADEGFASILTGHQQQYQPEVAYQKATLSGGPLQSGPFGFYPSEISSRSDKSINLTPDRSVVQTDEDLGVPPPILPSIFDTASCSPGCGSSARHIDADLYMQRARQHSAELRHEQSLSRQQSSACYSVLHGLHHPAAHSNEGHYL